MFTFPLSLFNSKTISNYSNTILSFNPKIYWRLEETTGTTITDTSTNNSSGTIQGTYTLAQSGSLIDNSKSILFTDAVVNSNILTLPSSNYTIIIRAKTSASSAGICAFSDGIYSAISYSPGLYLQNNKLNLYYYSGSVAYLTSTNDYNDNNWHSFAFSVGSSGTKVYVDGSVILSNINTQTASFTGYWLIGKTFSFNVSTNNFNGYLDEFSYFDTQLTDANILTIHQSV